MEEDSAQLSHDFEDSCMFPSDSTISAAKSFVHCVNTHVEGTYTSICLKNTVVYVLMYAQ